MCNLPTQKLQQEPVVLIGVFEVRVVTAGVKYLEFGIGDSVFSHPGMLHGYDAVLPAPDNQGGAGDFCKVIRDGTHEPGTLTENIHTDTQGSEEGLLRTG